MPSPWISAAYSIRDETSSGRSIICPRIASLHRLAAPTGPIPPYRKRAVLFEWALALAP